MCEERGNFVRLEPCPLECSDEQIFFTSLTRTTESNWRKTRSSSHESSYLDRTRDKEREARTDGYQYSRVKRQVCRLSLHVRILWTTLTLMVTITCGFSFLQPFWLVNTETNSSLGLYSFCLRDLRTRSIGTEQVLCRIYGGSFNLSNQPSNAWQIACVLYGGGCVMLCLGVFTALLSVCISSSTWSGRLATYTGYIQTMAVVTLVSGVLVFPFGLDSRFVQHYCPDSRIYWTGSCSVGWAYMLGIMGTALSVFCPYLSLFTDFRGGDTNTLYV